jgi:hypothetical protein
MGDLKEFFNTYLESTSVFTEKGVLQSNYLPQTVTTE